MIHRDQTRGERVKRFLREMKFPITNPTDRIPQDELWELRFHDTSWMWDLSRQDARPLRIPMIEWVDIVQNSHRKGVPNGGRTNLTQGSVIVAPRSVQQILYRHIAETMTRIEKKPKAIAAQPAHDTR
jgi:hypothetical protein